MQGPPAWLTALVNQGSDYCGQVGAPYPCAPYCDPRTARNGTEPEVMGAPIPHDRMKGCGSYGEAVKQLCWVETTIRSPAQVAAGASIEFSIEVKWWWQIQAIVNLGDQANATFDLVNIGYGQSNYNLEILQLLIDGVGTPQNGIDVRRWNIEMYDKFYPMPASGLNDPIVLTFTNVSGNAQDLELVLGGPAVLQIG